MKKLLLAGVAAAGMALAATGVQAAVIGNTPGGGPNPNNVIGAVEGWFGANIYYSGPAGASVDVWYLGKEAGFTNTFTINGVAPSPGPVTVTQGPNAFPSNVFFLGGVAPVLAGTLTIDPGLVNFSFSTSGPPAGSVLNGANLLPPPGPGTGTPNFFSSFASGPFPTVQPTATSFDTLINGSTSGSGQMVLLALDDGGAGPDDNHDDLVIVLRLSNGTFNIPEPTTLALFGAGLLGLGAVVRRRRKV
jgi:hypothetical protein